ncbi:MAG: tRNA lysidine(34) synthetase TilS [Lachnospiraceae bacterium]|nr:tRNA lysidine(34) synthetase TilS [Lachnospiraceae bacterium]
MKRMDQTTQKVKKYCETHGLLQRGDRVLVGVSGGADSVCLLFLLREFQELMDLQLRVVHVNHGIRKEAGEDARYVRELCQGLDIPYEQVDADVPALSKKLGISLEEAGREARYMAFEEHARRWTPEGGTVRVALAHHAGDRAETFLFHLFRGTGIKGLASIPPIRPLGSCGALVIRPLLCLERGEIEEYLKEKGISYCVDATNAEDTYARNRIRRHVLPYAEKEICEGALRHVNQAAEMLAETEGYLSEQTIRAMEGCASDRDGAVYVQVQPFLEEHCLIQKRILLELLWKLTPKHKDLGAVHVEAVRDLFLGDTGRSASLPFGIHARREYDFVVLENTGRAVDDDGNQKDYAVHDQGHKVSEGAPEEVFIELAELGEEPCFVSFHGRVFEFQRLEYKKKGAIPEKTYTKWFDYDKIYSTPSIRSRKTGDFFMIRGGDKGAVRKTVKDYFITEKVPRSEREDLPLLTVGSHVIWIPGHRISESFKIDEDTKVVLQVRLTEERDHGGAYQRIEI